MNEPLSSCKRCGGEVVQKNRWKLLFVGIVMSAALTLGFLWPILWIPAIILTLTGIYLMIWGIFGQGRWCRGCKRFDGV
jgi:hypothetical protein